MRPFSGQEELTQFATRFILDERLRSLENDVKLCILTNDVSHQPAPFPALLYCFSIIDLLGALLGGNANPHGPTATQAAAYMNKFMNYTEEQSRLLQTVFRHKLVHLAQPRAVVRSNSRLIVWREWHHNCEKHLVLEALGKKETEPVTSRLSVEYDHVFHISIWNLVEDIKLSVQKPGGYLDSLKFSADLRESFGKAISQIYAANDD